MRFFNNIKKLIKIVSMISLCLTNVVKYKLRFMTLEDAVISTCNSLTRSNYMFTKVIQWGVQEIHHKVNIKDNDKLKKYFSAFSNNVPYTPHELEHSVSFINNSVIKYANSKGDELAIERGDYNPMNSGSIALVFKARLNHIPVVIKILRPNIINKIKEDVDVLLHFFDNIIVKKLIGSYIKINFKNFIINNIDIFLNQCDFTSEVKNALIFKNNFKNKKHIIVPNVYAHFTEKLNEIIIMDYLDGVIAKDVPPESLTNYFEPLQSFFFESLFRYNILHGDFHLGNIIIMNGGDDIGIIDFGIVYSLTDEISNDLFDIMFLCLNSDKIKNLYTILKISIRFVCSSKDQHESIFEIMKQDDEFESMIRCNDWSGNLLIKLINKLMSLENVDLKPKICQLFLSTMSGLETIERTNNNKSLAILTKSFINKNICFD